MTSRDFCYWLQGYFEIDQPEELTKEKLEKIRNHLNMVFKHEIDPSFGDDLPDLQKIHEGHHHGVDPSMFTTVNC